MAQRVGMLRKGAEMRSPWRSFVVLLRQEPSNLHCGVGSHWERGGGGGRNGVLLSKVLEVGCGNGSTVLPILRAKQSIVVYACDCSAEVLETAKEMIATANIGPIKHRFHPFLLEFSVNPFPNWLFCANCQKKPLANPTGLFSGANPDNMSGSTSLKGSQCCIGGVDFITLGESQWSGKAIYTTR